jgi:uncharacterized membrane-anchored protein
MASKVLFLAALIASVACAGSTGASAATSVPARSGPAEIRGPGSIQLGDDAVVRLPDGFGFLDQEGTRQMLQRLGSIATGSEIGMITPASHDWFVVLKILPVGYTDDYGWEDLDSTNVLADLRAIEAKANVQRAATSAGAVDLTGWVVPPVYDSVNHRLEWAVNAATKTGTVINRVVTVLGRNGSIQFFLVDQSNSEKNVAHFHRLVRGFAYLPGRRYEDHSASDSRAPGDLAFLITGTTHSPAKAALEWRVPQSFDRNAIKRHLWALPCMIGVTSGILYLGLNNRELWNSYKTSRRRRRAVKHARRAGVKPRVDPVKYYAMLTRDVYRS